MLRFAVLNQLGVERLINRGEGFDVEHDNSQCGAPIYRMKRITLCWQSSVTFTGCYCAVMMGVTTIGVPSDSIEPLNDSSNCAPNNLDAFLSKVINGVLSFE